MADRATLAFSKLDEFAEWAATKGWVREETKGEYEVLRLRKASKPKPLLFYTRAHAKEHATIPYGAEGLVRSWFQHRRRATPESHQSAEETR